jgi:hypothetical protein
MSCRTSVAGFLLLVGGSQTALAYCSEGLDYSVPAEFRRSDVVAVVRAEAVNWLDENRKPTKLKPPLALGDIPGGLDPYVGAYYSVRLERAYKGNPPSTFQIFSENTTARTPLVMGKSLLVFLTRAKQNDEFQRVGDLTVDSCGNSALAAKAPKTIRLVGQLSARP